MIRITPIFLAAVVMAAALSQAHAQASKGQTVNPGPAGLPGFAELTEQECRNLGGAVHTAPQCKKTGTRCVIRLAGGQTNAPCIDEVATKK